MSEYAVHGFGVAIGSSIVAAIAGAVVGVLADVPFGRNAGDLVMYFVVFCVIQELISRGFHEGAKDSFRSYATGVMVVVLPTSIFLISLVLSTKHLHLGALVVVPAFLIGLARCHERAVVGTLDAPR